MCGCFYVIAARSGAIKLRDGEGELPGGEVSLVICGQFLSCYMFSAGAGRGCRASAPCFTEFELCYYKQR